MADTHLSVGVDKPMDIFGSRWGGYTEKIERCWRAAVRDGDTVLIPGDFSWGMRLEEALPDFLFMHALPGKKVLLKGNHDFWWETQHKLSSFLTEHGLDDFSFIHNSALLCEDFIVAGTRGWYTDERKQATRNDADAEKIINREVGRLRASLAAAVALQQSDAQHDKKEIVVCLHFPPCFGDYVCTQLIDVLCEYGVRRCFYGHIHGSYQLPQVTEYRGMQFFLISADYLDFCPYRIVPLPDRCNNARTL